MMKNFQDQLGRSIAIRFPPKRIISLVPSQTELLYDLGSEESIVGITKFCIRPPHLVRTKTRVGGTKNINIDKVISLNPDLIIANKEENEEKQIKELMDHFPVWISDIRTLSNAYEMIQKVGEMTSKENEAEEIVKKISDNFSGIKHLMGDNHGTTCAYLIWYDPYMTVGNDTFISHMLNKAGYKNVFDDRTRYPEITNDDLNERSPSVILLSSEPYPFREKHKVALQAEFPDSKILLVDGEMFSWYGSRLQYAPGYFSMLSKLL